MMKIIRRTDPMILDHPMTENERDDVLRLHQFILYNDSVVFESYGGYPGGRGFPDKEKFENRRDSSDQ